MPSCRVFLKMSEAKFKASAGVLYCTYMGGERRRRVKRERKK